MWTLDIFNRLPNFVPCGTLVIRNGKILYSAVIRDSLSVNGITVSGIHMVEIDDGIIRDAPISITPQTLIDGGMIVTRIIDEVVVDDYIYMLVGISRVGVNPQSLVEFAGGLVLVDIRTKTSSLLFGSNDYTLSNVGSDMWANQDALVQFNTGLKGICMSLSSIVEHNGKIYIADSHACSPRRSPNSNIGNVWAAERALVLWEWVDNTMKMRAASAAGSIISNLVPGKYSKVIHDRSLFSTGSRIGVILYNKNLTYRLAMAWFSMPYDASSIGKWVSSGDMFNHDGGRCISYPSYVLPYRSLNSGDSGLYITTSSTRTGTTCNFRLSENNLECIRTGYVVPPKNICGVCIADNMHYKITCGPDELGSYSVRVSYRILVDNASEVTMYEYK
jgi:hypothetical protein